MPEELPAVAAAPAAAAPRAAAAAAAARGAAPRRGAASSRTPTPTAKATAKRARAEGEDDTPQQETPEQKKARQAAKMETAKQVQKITDDAQAALSLMGQTLSQTEFIIHASNTDPKWSWAKGSKAESRLIDCKSDLEQVAAPGSFIRDAMMMGMDNLESSMGVEAFQLNMARLPGMVGAKINALKNVIQRMNDLHALHMDD
eukprot:1846379-Pyramimonas_sp.AAC.1